jgi:hypothetical protein
VAIRTVFHDLPSSRYGDPPKILCYKVVAVCVKQACDHWQLGEWYRVMPQRKALWKPDFLANTPDPRYLFDIYGYSALWTVALKQPIFKYK